MEFLIYLSTRTLQITVSSGKLHAVSNSNFKTKTKERSESKEKRVEERNS